MALSHSPSIVTNGLVLCLDAANLKSFKGEETTNVVSDASTMIGWSPYGYGNDGTFITEFGTTGYRIINRGSWNGIAKGIILPSTGTYTISAWFRYWGGAADNNGATVYTSGGGIFDTAAYIDKTKIGVWQRISMTRTYSSTSLTFYIISFGGTSGGSNSTWDVTMPQIEQKGYATNFVNGTRGTTVAAGGGWADLSGTSSHGQVVNGVTYNESNGGSLVFDGANDYVNIGVGRGVNQFSGDFAVSVWIMRTAGGPTWGNIIGDYYTGSVATTNEWQIMMSGSGQLNLYRVGSGYVISPIASGYSLNQWINVVVTRISGTFTLYVNGNSLGSTANSEIFGTATGNLNIGIDGNNSSEPLSGRIANVMIYKNKGLTSAEVNQNFNALRGRFGI